MTLRELELRLAKLREEGAPDTAEVRVPCCTGWASLDRMEFKPDFGLIAAYPKKT